MPRPGGWIASLLPFVGQRSGFVRQSALAVIADIKLGQEQALRQELEGIGDRLRSNQNILFHNMQTVHYAAWLILPAIKGDSPENDRPARLLLETNYDGTLENHLNELIDKCRPELDNVYSHCERYPGSTGNSPTPEALKTYLSELFGKTARNPYAYFVAMPGRSVADIRKAICVYEEAKSFLDVFGKGKPADEVQTELVAHFQTMSDPMRPGRFAITQKGLRRLFAYNVLLLFPLLLLYLVFLWVPLILIARCFEKKEQSRPPVRDPTDHPEEYTYLDLGKQNHFCTFATVKPGRFRMFVVKRALGLGRILSTRFFIQGKLDQMKTVYFARWLLIDRQLLFVGNYDDSWSGYLSDFSDQAWGVNLIWSNTLGFPPTRFLMRGGASDLHGFQTQALRHYSPAPVFYTAYGKYSLPNILRFLELHDELAEAMLK